MNISIQPVQESDLPTIGKLMTAYKISMSINRLLWKLWPNEPLQQAQVLDSVNYSFNDPAAQLFKAVDSGNGEIVGFMAMTRRTPAPPPPPPSLSATEAQATTAESIEVPDRFNPGVFSAVVNAVNDINKEIESLDHLDISAFVVRQDHYRNGIGSQLVQVAFDKATAENIPVIARSEPASHAFCKKHGFQDLKVVDLDLATWAEPVSGYGVFRLAGMIWYP